MGFTNVILLSLLINVGNHFPFSDARRSVGNTEHRNFMVFRTNTMSQRVCNCTLMNSCACCETVRIFYTSEAKRLCFNMVYQRNGLNFDISLDTMMIKAMTVANYRPFQMCSPLPGLLFSSVCVNILELNQFSRSITVCPRIEVTNKKERWQMTYTCVSISTVLPTMNAAGMMTAAVMQPMMPGAMGQMMAGTVAGGMGQMMPPAAGAAMGQMKPPTVGGAMVGQATPGAAPVMMGQIPPTGAMGQMPPTGAMGQRPPAGGPMGQIPPAGPMGQRPPAGGPMAQGPPAGGPMGQMPPAGTMGQSPPAGGPMGQKPPAGGPMGQGPPAGGPIGQMPPAGPMGQRPPAGGAMGQRPPAGGPMGQMPPVGAMGPMPSGGGTPLVGQINPRPGGGASFIARSSALRTNTTLSPKDHIIESNAALTQEVTTPLYNNAVDSMVSLVQKLMSGESTETRTDLTTSLVTDYKEFTTEFMIPIENSDQKMVIADSNESIKIQTKGDDFEPTTLKRTKRNSYDMFDLLHQSNRCMRAYRICVTRTKHYIVSRLRNTRTGLKTKHTECSSDQPARIVYGLEENPCPNLSVSESNDSIDITAAPEIISSSDSSQSDDTLGAIVVHDETFEGSDYYPQSNQHVLPMIAYSRPEIFPMRTPPLIALQVKADLSRSTNESLIFAGSPDEFTHRDLEGLIN